MLLYRWFDDTRDQTHLCLVVPSKLTKEVMFLVRVVPAGGHLGLDKTMEQLRRHFFWPFMRQECQLYIQGCSQCNQHKKPQTHARAKAPEGTVYTILPHTK
jgi:hypothetical protein